MGRPNYYHTLGVPEDADDESIKAAYKRQAKALHPDVCLRPTAQREFQDLQEAFATLSDASLRREHNATLALAKVSDLPADPIDEVMNNYGIEPHTEKKKKKKKKKHKEPKGPKPPQHQGPPSEAHYEDIPPGYEPRLGFL